MAEYMSTPRYPDRIKSPRRLRSDHISSTAYTGSDGYINDVASSFLELEKDELDDSYLTASSKLLAPTREGLGSRLLSSLSNAQPAAAALRRSGSVLHARTRSWAAYVPKLNTPVNTTPEKQHSPNKLFGDLFNGESAPVRIGVPGSPTKEETEFIMEYRPSLTERPIRRLKRTETGSLPTPTSASKLSWFGRKQSLPAPITSAQDEILNMNINNNLFPDGPADPLSPYAFNDLLLNATNLLQRMQTAYREKVDYIDSMQPEMDVQKEEVEEAETRAEHLKLQLEDMGRRAQEQERVNQELTEELSETKHKLQGVRESAPTIKLVQNDHDQNNDTIRRRKRASAGSASDSGFESDADTVSSVFSGGMVFQPRTNIRPEYHGIPWEINSNDIQDRHTLSRGSTISERSETSRMSRLGNNGGAAWATVEQLRNENHALSKQVQEMQHTLQECIDLVGNVGGGL